MTYKRVLRIASALCRGKVIHGKTRRHKEPFTVGPYHRAVGPVGWALIVDPNMRLVVVYPDAFEAAAAADHLAWTGVERFLEHERFADPARFAAANEAAAAARLARKFGGRRA